jgi:hypothetical protein
MCLLVTLTCGCAGLRRAEPPAPIVPEPVEAEPPVRALVVEPMPRPLPLQAQEPSAVSYDVSQALMRPPQVEGRLDAPLKRRWKYIVLHHSDGEQGSEAIFDRYHRQHNGWRGVGYDFVIGNGHGAADGLVEVTFRWEQQLDGAHAGHDEYNQHGIGICLVGDFDRGYPTAKQMEALVGLVNYLQERCDIPTDNILGHCHVRPGGTRCPGKNFPWYEFFSLLNH